MSVDDESIDLITMHGMPPGGILFGSPDRIGTVVVSVVEGAP